MKPIEIQNLDQHLKPLQVGGVSTGLELSTEGFRISSGELEIKNLTSETAKVDGDLTVDGNIQMSGESGTKINMYRDVYLEATSNDDYLEIGAKNIILNSAVNYTDANAGVFLQPDTGFDSHLTFLEGASARWTIGHDATDNSLKFDGGTTVVGANTFLELSTSALTVAGSVNLKEKAAADADTAAYGQLWVKTATPNLLYFTNDAGTDIQLTTADAVNASGGSSTQYWHTTIGAYKTNNNSASIYYTFYRVWFENWSNADSDPSTIADTDSYSTFFIAPRAGTITNMKVQGWANDTGATDPFKFYLYKAAMSNNSDTVSLTSMVNSGTVTPPGASKTFSHTVDFSSDNTFAEDDCLYIWLKKDSTSGNQDLYFTITLNGEYS